MKFVELKFYEKVWFEKILSYDFPEKDIVRKQLESSEYERELGYSYVILWINNTKADEKIKNEVSVPIELCVNREGEKPVSILLHVKEGDVIELEVYTLDNSFLVPTFSLDNVEYFINTDTNFSGVIPWKR